MDRVVPTSAHFPGIWLSEYTYHSTSKNADLQSRHYVRMFEEGTAIVVESLPENNESYLLIRLSLDGSVATGSWQEQTSPGGDYQGAIYYGALQMVVSDDCKTLEGKWVGFGKRMDIKTGPWTLRYVAATAAELPI